MNIDLAGVSVMLVMPINRDLPWQTAQSLLATAINLTQMKVDFEVQFVIGSSIVEVARSKSVHVFLKSDKAKMVFLDSDQTWEADAMLRLLALSTKMDVVVGAYPTKQDPCLYMLNPVKDANELNAYGCLPVNGMGLGFAVVDRKLLQLLSSKAPVLQFPNTDEPMAHIFRQDSVNGAFRGEDMAFFADLQDLGATIWLDPALQIGHVGGKEYKGNLKDSLVTV